MALEQNQSENPAKKGNLGSYLIGGALVLVGLAIIFKEPLKRLLAKKTGANPMAKGAGGILDALPNGAASAIGEVVKACLTGRLSSG